MQRTILLLAWAAAVSVAPEAAHAQQPAAVRVWDSVLTLPSYAEGLPDPNPPFDAFGHDGRPNYPYTIRDRLTDRRAPRSWRAIWLENAYLRCAVLPEVGGHLYDCQDRRNGQSMFYDNPSLKLASIAYRGSWAAFGVEFNFPVSHNWMTTSPVDVSWGSGPDGSAWVAVGNIDRVYGMQWTVELRLRPDRAVLEQVTTLYNRSDLRRRFYWWTNAGVRVTPDSRIIYPMRFTASHGFTDVDTWPVDRSGTDQSVFGNHRAGPVSRFAHGSREPFMAVWHPSRDAGVVHWSSPSDLPAKKIWSWGGNADALDWRRVLSDDSSAYVEIQAGLFRDQETYAYFHPQERVRFTEYWLPIRQLGGLTRAMPDAAVHMWRDSGQVRVALNVTRPLANARLELAAEGRPLKSEAMTLGPERTVRFDVPLPGSGRATFTLRDSGGRVLLTHTEETFDFLPDSLIRTGPRAPPPVTAPQSRTEGEWLAVADELELNGHTVAALRAYQDGLRRFPGSLPLERAAGRLAVNLRQFALAESLLADVALRTSTDYEAVYYLAVARLARGDTSLARRGLELAQQFGPLRPAAVWQLAALDARQGRTPEALTRLQEVVAEDEGAVRLRIAAAMLARTLRLLPDARLLLARARAQDPTGSWARYEAVLLGAPDSSIWTHLAADPERILEIAAEYIRFGLYQDALHLLSREWPVTGVVGEPGAVPPARYPLLAYWRGWVRERLWESGAADFSAASRMPVTYVFPNRVEDLVVLRRALAVNLDDATAHHLLGMLYLAGGSTAEAITEWRAAAQLEPTIPTLHRNLGYALLFAGRPPAEARDVLEAGVRYDPMNPAVYVGLDSTLVLLGAGAADRARSLDRYPALDSLPVALVYHLIRLRSAAGRHDDAEQLFRGRFFARREGGTNVRQVWLEVRVARAEALVAGGRCADARRVLDGLGRPVSGLAFTRDGLEPFLRSEPLAGRINRARSSCAR